MSKKVKTGKSFFTRFLSAIEITGNALPHPATLFAIFAMSIIFLSGLAEFFNWTAIHPTTKEIVSPVNLMSKD